MQFLPMASIKAQAVSLSVKVSESRALHICTASLTPSSVI